MKIVNVDVKYLALILLISVVFAFDLFANIGGSANGDGLIHTLVPNLFAKALKQGNFPVGWTDGFANYGLPLGTVSQQLTTYLSAFVIMLSHNPVLGFNIASFLGILLSSAFFYFFLRIYFEPFPAFLGIFLFNFTPYRILNVYLRGALPEFFAGVFFPLLLISSYLVIVKKNMYGFFLFIISFALLTLTHPFMDIVVLFLLIPYILFLIFSTKNSFKIYVVKTIRYAVIFLSGLIFAIFMASYYIIPLMLEIKYFYYGQGGNHLTPNNFLLLANYFSYNYIYFSPMDIFNRGFTVNVGVIESIIFVTGIIYFFYRSFSKKIKELSIIDFATVSGIILIFMMSPLSKILYTHINFLSNIQFPWRMLSAFIFLPPILFAFFVSRVNNKFFPFVSIASILLISFFAFPQLYGKNYTVFPQNYYSFTPLNLDAVVMNTIWTGNSEEYPITQQKAAIIGGKGSILSQQVFNNKRIYTVSAQNQLRLIDRTFYFPGWKVLIDGVNIPIQYQDPAYRGVITYDVPAGKHTVLVLYTDTKVRLLGKIVTIASLVLLCLLFLLRKPLKNFLV